MKTMRSRTRNRDRSTAARMTEEAWKNVAAEANGARQTVGKSYGNERGREVEGTTISMEKSDKESPSPVNRETEREAINTAFKSKRRQRWYPNFNIAGEMIRHVGVTLSKRACRCKVCKELVNGQPITQFFEDQIGPIWRTV